MKIAIIGGGISGLICAIELGKDNSNKIDIYEKNNKLARKLLASGNGRCNITNSNLDKDYYNNPSFASNILLPYNQIKEYLNNLGLLLSEPDSDGRVYPISFNSYTVYDCFINNLNSKNTNIFYSTYIDDIKVKNNKYIVNNNEYDCVVVAIGSMADEKTSHNKLEQSLINLKYNYTKCYPSLSSLPVNENIKDLDGLRIKCHIIMNVDDKEFENGGELIFKKDEVGGIVVMELSHILNNLRRSNKINNVTLSIDLLPESKYSYEKHNFVEDKYNKTKNYDKTLNGIFVKKLNKEIIKRVNEFDKNQQNIDKALRITSKGSLLNTIIHDFKLTVNLNRTPSMYHVICGGLDLKNITSSLEAKRNPNLYFGGEVIDINGQCGGYNISFAISSGIKIAKSIMGKKYEK